MNWQHLDHVQLVEDLRNAFIGCVLSGAAECFALLRQASSDYQWSVQGRGGGARAGGHGRVPLRAADAVSAMRRGEA